MSIRDVVEGDRAEMERIGRVLKERRLALGLSQEALARLVDLNDTYISRMETGKTNSSFVAILHACRALGIHPRDLFE